MNPLPSYLALTKAIQTFQPNGQAAQIHGLLCGYLCTIKENRARQWEDIFPNIQKNKKCYQLLHQVIEISYRQLCEFSFEFRLILPAEKININTRAEALGLWCQGFLTGLKNGDISIENRKSSQVTETLNDLLEISAISFDDIVENEEDESAYLELAEYVRLSVVMIFHELKTDLTPELLDNN